MKRYWIVHVLWLTSALVLVGCEGDNEDTDPSPAAAVSSDRAGTAEDERADDDEARLDLFEEPVPAWQIDLQIVGGPATFTAAEGITLEVLDARISDLSQAPDEVLDAMVVGDEGPVPVVFNLKLQATNATSQDIEWFTHAGLEVAGVGSLDADAWNGTWLPGDGLPSGTTSIADLVYTPPEEVTIEDLSSGEGRLEAGVPYDIETGTRLGDQLDLTFAWQPE